MCEVQTVVQNAVMLAGPELAAYAREARGGVELAVAQRRALILLVHIILGAAVHLMTKELIHCGRRLGGGEIAVELGVARAAERAVFAGEAVARAPGVRRSLWRKYIRAKIVK